MSKASTATLRICGALVGIFLVAAGSAGLTSQPAQAADEKGSVHAAINGSGSTWSANATQQWIRNVWANYQWKITYSESGSTQGRNDFANGTADFGVSEIQYSIANGNEIEAMPKRPFAYMPIVAGGTSFMYNLKIGGKQVTNLRLSGDTIAKIFTGVITRWDDAAIKADNPSLALPGIPIVPVVRSDGSGATAQFSIWMRQEHTAEWDAYCGVVQRSFVNGHCGVTSVYPTVAGKGFVSKSGSNGVAGYVAQPHAEGAITFVEYSYALNAGFPVAKMLNEAGYYVEPTASNVAVALLKAKINQDKSSVDYLTQDLSDVYVSSDPRAYPLSSYSYIILPTSQDAGFTLDKGLTLADFGSYFLCEGQQQADVLGYSPLPINLVQAGHEQIAKIPGGDPVFKGVTDCNNPTFSPDGSNKLANEAPYPQECDKVGGTQCTTGTGGSKDTPTEVSASGGTTGGTTSGSGTTGAGTADGSADGDTAGSGSADGEDGSGIADTGATTAQTVVAASPQSIGVDSPAAVTRAATVGAGVMMLGATLVPPLLGRRRGIHHAGIRKAGIAAGSTHPKGVSK